MPKTPSQKKNSRRKRVSLGRQEENQAKRRCVAFIKVLVMGIYPFLQSCFKHILPLCKQMFLSCPGFQRESAVTSEAPLSNHWTSLLKKDPFLSPPLLKPAPPHSLNAPPAKTNRQSQRWQRMWAIHLMAAVKLKRCRTRSPSWQRKKRWTIIRRWTMQKSSPMTHVALPSLQLRYPHLRLLSTSHQQTACPLSSLKSQNPLLAVQLLRLQ